MSGFRVISEREKVTFRVEKVTFLSGKRRIRRLYVERVRILLIPG